MRCVGDVVSDVISSIEYYLIFRNYLFMNLILCLFMLWAYSFLKIPTLPPVTPIAERNITVLNST